MDVRTVIIICMTFIVTYIGTLAYAVRIVGVRTGRIAISFSLFNVLVLVSRLASNIQAPLLTKYTEIANGGGSSGIFYNLLIAGAIATAAGAVSIPTFQRVFTKAVNRFSVNRSVPRILIHGFSKAGVKQFRACVTVPRTGLKKRIDFRELPLPVMLMNTIAVAVMTVGAIAPIYSGILEPALRATCITLSGVINGVATILLYVFVDPYLSVKTDDVLEGKLEESEFRRLVTGMTVSKMIGAVLAIPLFVPASRMIAWIARLI